MKQTISPQRLLALLFVTAIPVGMLAIRHIFTTGWSHLFMVWNLFLAWMPAFFALLTYQYQHKRGAMIGFSILWLLFFPNAPYMVTDLIHLRPFPNVPLWYDALMLFAFALSGLLLSFVSLAWMQQLVAHHWGKWTSWGFVLVSLSAGSFGVFIGRFLRWNSWDALLNPLSLSHNLWQAFTDPYWGWRLIGASLLFNILLLLSYLVFQPPQFTHKIGGI